MDNRFLARGKRKDNGEWVEGDLIRSKGLYYIHPLSNGVTVKDTLSRLIVMHEIDSSTIGWGTSLNDKNSKKIFEGDIVKAKFHGGIFPDVEPDFTEKIVFRNGCFWFGNWNFIEFLDKFRNYEIIGNIHDNKKMLERADMPVPDDVSQPVLAPATPENFELMHG